MEALHGRTFDPELQVPDLADARVAFLVHVGDVHPSGIGDLPVDQGEFAVVAGDRQQAVVECDLHAEVAVFPDEGGPQRPPQAFLVRTLHASERVEEHAGPYARPHPFRQGVHDGRGDVVFPEDEILHEDEVPRAADVLEHGGVEYTGTLEEPDPVARYGAGTSRFWRDLLLRVMDAVGARGQR